MGQLVEVPGQGTVEFPDGMSEEDIVKAIKKNSMTPIPKMGTGEDVVRSAVSGIPNAAANLVDLPLNLMNLVPLLASKIPPFPGNKPEPYQPVIKPVLGDIAKQGYQEMGVMHKPETTAGRYAQGTVEGALSLPTSPSMVVTGVGAGLGQTAGGDIGEKYGGEQGRKIGSFAGGLAGGLGTARLIRPIQNTLSPEAQNIVQQAKDYGMKLTPGQATGNRRMLAFENTTEALPGGGYLAQNRAENLAKANQVALNQVGQTGGEITPNVLGEAAQKIGAKFDQLTQGRKIVLDRQFFDDVKKIAASQKMLREPNPDVQKMLDAWTPAQGTGKVTIPSEAYQANRSMYATEARQAFRQEGGAQVARAKQALVTALDNAAQRSLPASDLSAFKQARKEWANLEPLEASDVSKTGYNVNPNNLANALRKQNPKVGRIPLGDRPMVDISRMGNLLRDVTPNSGTPERAFWINLLTSGGGAGLGSAGGVPGAAIGAALAPWLAPAIAQRTIMAPGINPWLSGQLMPSFERPALSEQALRALSMQPQ